MPAHKHCVEGSQKILAILVLIRAPVDTHLDNSLSCCRVSVKAATEDGKVASETFPVTFTGQVDVSPATIVVKSLDLSVEKQRTQLDFPQQLSKAIPLDHRSQMKVGVCICVFRLLWRS